MRPATAMTAFLSLVGVAFAAGGCDWREFDSLKKETPVLSVGAPSGYGESHSFGQITLPVAPPADGSAAGRFVASAGTKPRIAVIDLDAAGRPHGQNVESPLLDSLDASSSAITAMAEVPGRRLALLGVPTAPELLTMELDPPYTISSFISSPEPQLGVGVAAADLGGGPAPELIALSAVALHVYVDGQASVDLAHGDAGPGDPCPIALPNSLPGGDRVNRAVVVGRLLGTGVQIAVGTPTTTGAGVVSVFNVDLATQTFTCALALRAPASAVAEPRFGRSLAIADFNADGVPDLLVGSPPTAAYLFLGPLTATPAKTIPNSNPAGDTAGDFGKAVAAFDMDGIAGPEALIGDPSATIGERSGAGNVHVFTGPTLASELAPALVAHDPKDGDGYGITVAGLSFCPGAGGDGGAASGCTKLPMIGAGSKIFTYFTLGSTDPRVK
jgi:hypothetical protein